MQTIKKFVNSFQDCQAFIAALLKEPILVVILDDESSYASNHSQLISAVNHFIFSINQHISSFPQSFSCIIEYLHQSLISSNDTRKIETFIVSLITDIFICSPLLSPLQHDNHFINPSVTHNLKLIAKVLKALVLRGLDCNVKSGNSNAKLDLDDDVSALLDNFDLVRIKKWEIIFYLLKNQLLL